ncbi:MAG: ATP-binding protein [Desulfobacterales bacterium]|jgi:two-component system phosphate regulon sensor histidine kinase PhoR
MKKNKRLIWQLYPTYLLIIVGSLIAVTWYASSELGRFYLDQTETVLEARAYLLKDQISNLLSPPEPKLVDAICKEAGQLSATRITVILPDGTVVGDSRETPRFMDNHAAREEVAPALRGVPGKSIRFSNTLHQKMMYVAVPVKKEEHLQAVIRTAVPLTSLDQALTSVRLKIAFGGLVVAVLAALLSLAVARRISQPIEEIKRGAVHFADGDLTHRLPSPDTEEMAGLTETLNRMAAQLDERIKTVFQQRNELEAVLSSMLEGVIAVDRNERIINMNPAAGRMFDCDPAKVQGRNIQEVVRNLAIQRFVTRVLTTSETISDDFILYRAEERTLNIHSSPLYDAGSVQIGALLVMNDVTQLRHLENVRRDFVANVSHEIKTPLTAIKGFVETLQLGTVEDEAEQKRFLGIVLKHVNRLGAILEDLLALSRLSIGRIKEVIQTAIQVCQPKAAARGITISTDAAEDLTANLDATLLEQAFVNLIDNAVKYSDDGSQVRITAAQKKREVTVEFADQGSGIPNKHLPRLFERFYRVDKARSRKLGGTGLGLAIVKHIVQAHGGHITVESSLGQGSTFTVHLPLIG